MLKEMEVFILWFSFEKFKSLSVCVCGFLAKCIPSPVRREELGFQLCNLVQKIINLLGNKSISHAFAGNNFAAFSYQSVFHPLLL